MLKLFRILKNTWLYGFKYAQDIEHIWMLVNKLDEDFPEQRILKGIAHTGKNKYKKLDPG